MKEKFNIYTNKCCTNKLLNHNTIVTCCWLFNLGLGVHVPAVITLHGNGMKRITQVTSAPTLIQLINHIFLCTQSVFKMKLNKRLSMQMLCLIFKITIQQQETNQKYRHYSLYQ